MAVWKVIITNLEPKGRMGDPGRAVCLFSMERILQLQKEGHPIDIGSTGENLTSKEWIGQN